MDRARRCRARLPARFALLFSLLLAALAPGGAGAETIVLANGDTLTGEVISRSAEQLVLEHAVLGRVEVPVDALQPPEPPDAGILDSGFLAGWTRRIDLAFNGSRGNSQNAALRGGIDLDFEDDRRRWAVDGRYFFASTDGLTEENQFRATVDRDWLLPGSPWFWFAQGQYDWDEFEAWDHRLKAFGGPGRTLVKRERFELLARLGAGLVKEFGGADDLRPEVVFRLSGKWALAEGQTLTLDNAVFPSLDTLGEFRNVTRAELAVQLTAESPFHLKLGIENEYESQAEPGTKKNDLQYYGGLGLSF